MIEDDQSALLCEIREIRKLLELIAEPAIAQRDAKFRSDLRSIVGSSSKGRKSVLLMDGTRTQAGIVGQTNMSKGNLSTLVSRLEEAGLLAEGKKYPKLIIQLPSNFFDADS